nr:hypothetical protein Iba_chr11dCG13780 [Ipomoea batatas]
MLGDNNPAVPYFRLSSNESVDAPIPVDSVNPYPCRIVTPGYLSTKPSITSLLKGAPPERTFFRLLRSYFFLIESAKLISATRIGGTSGRYDARLVFGVELEFPPMSTTGRFESASFGRSSVTVKARTGFESEICLPISRGVLSGDVATDSTALQTSEKLSWRPVAASMKAIFPWWARDDMKVVTSIDSGDGRGIGFRLL